MENKPDYYKVGIEVWDFIQSWDLDFFEGNIVKYISRAGLKTKSKLADYEKALAYAKRLPECGCSCVYMEEDNEIDVFDYIDSWDMSGMEAVVIEHVMDYSMARRRRDKDEAEIDRCKEDLCAALEYLIRKEKQNESKIDS